MRNKETSENNKIERKSQWFGDSIHYWTNESFHNSKNYEWSPARLTAALAGVTGCTSSGTATGHSSSTGEDDYRRPWCRHLPFPGLCPHFALHVVVAVPDILVGHPTFTNHGGLGAEGGSGDVHSSKLGTESL